MHNICRNAIRRRGAVLALAFVAWAAGMPTASYADPPPWAPAHGWRKQHDPDYVGYTGRKWDNDYGVVGGHCNRVAVGAVVGGAVGGVIGSQVGKGNGRAVATIAGAVLGAVIGASIGRNMDETDRACFGHALELAPDGRSVVWDNQQRGVAYVVTPMRGYAYEGRTCREYATRVTIDGRQESAHGTACRTGDGTWQIVSH